MSTDDQNKKPRDLGEKVGEHVRISQRDDSGIFYVTYQYEGKQYRSSLKTRSKKEATRRATKLDIQLQEGTYQQKAETKSIAEAIKLYLAQATVDELYPDTIKKYRRDLNRMLGVAESLRRPKLSQIDLVHIDAYKLARSKSKKPISANTVFKEIMTIRSFINWCLSRKYLKDDPLAGLHLSQPKTSDQPWWTWDEVHEILHSSPKSLQPAFAILAFSGMRYGELRWLTWDDVDFKENLIHIRSKDGWKPKSKDQRVVPIMPELIPYLMSLPKDSRWVVTMPVSKQQPHAGKQLTRNALLKRLKRVLKKLGLKGHVHTFRHSFISYCVAQGKQEVFIRAWVGHVDAKILRRYTHIHSKQSQEAMKSLSQMVKPPSPETGGGEKKSA